MGKNTNVSQGLGSAVALEEARERHPWKMLSHEGMRDLLPSTCKHVLLYCKWSDAVISSGCWHVLARVQEMRRSTGSDSLYSLHVFTRRSKGSQTLLPLLSSPKFINKPNFAPESIRPLLADLGRDLSTLTSQDMGVKYAASREVLGRGKKDDSIH